MQYRIEPGRVRCPASELDDELLWLFNSSTGLFPSIYLQKGSRYLTSHAYVQCVVAEARRLRALCAGAAAAAPILPFANLHYQNHGPMLNTTAAAQTEFATAKTAGADGLVVWCGSCLLGQGVSCEEYGRNFERAVAPVLHNVTHRGIS